MSEWWNSLDDSIQGAVIGAIGSLVGTFLAVAVTIGLAAVAIIFEVRKTAAERKEAMKRSILEAFMDACFNLQRELSYTSPPRHESAYLDYLDRIDRARSAAAHRAANVTFLLATITKRGNDSRPAVWFRKTWKVLRAQMHINSLFETDSHGESSQNAEYVDTLSSMVNACQYWAFTPTKTWQNSEPPVKQRTDLSQVIELPGPTRWINRPDSEQGTTDDRGR